MSRWIRREAAPPGSTGNNTHPGVEIDPSVDVEQLAFRFIVEVIGATPTVTYKWQITLDPPDITDANAAWVDLPYVLPADTTEAVAVATRARTTVGSDTLLPFAGTKAKQLIRRARLVTSLNTNVTYRATVEGIDSTP